VRSTDFSLSQSLVATGGVEKLLRVYDLNHNKSPLEIGSHAGTIKSVVWDRASGADTEIITSGDDKMVLWWDTRSSGPVSKFTADEMISSMEPTVDRKRVVVTAGKSVLIFDSAT
jgi:serine-threonine kinase receptor-associated protein